VGFWIASFTIPPIVGLLLPAKKPLSPAVVLALLLLQAFGIVLRWWSMSVLGAFFSRTLKVVDEQRVIQHGPYRWVRHPGYLANLFSFVPYTVVTSAHWLVGLGTLAVFGIIYRYRMDAEEGAQRATCDASRARDTRLTNLLPATAMLSSSPQLGAAYRSYMSRSWRLIPLLY